MLLICCIGRHMQQNMALDANYRMVRIDLFLHFTCKLWSMGAYLLDVMMIMYSNVILQVTFTLHVTPILQHHSLVVILHPMCHDFKFIFQEIAGFVH